MKRPAFLLRLAALLVLSAGPTAVAAADAAPEEDGRLARILERGRLIVGVKSDYPPWGMVAEDGAIVGLEPDLAQDLADRIGVGLELVPVTSANRLSRLNQGVIDVAIATIGDTEERQKSADLLRPHYYASGVTLLAPKGSPFTDWGQLRGRPVCLTDGAYFNRALVERYLIRPVVFSGLRDALLALRDGRCAGMAFDDTVLAQTLGDPQWADYHLATPSILSTPWAVAVQTGEGGRDLGRLVEEAVADWHRSGRIIALQARWGLPPSAFLAAFHDTWSAEADGRTVCARTAAGAWPEACLGGGGIRIAGLGGELPGWAARLRATTGLDLSPAFDRIDRARLLRGIGLTLALSLVAIAGSLTVGICLALADATLRRGAALAAVLAHPIRGFVVLVRMTPPILQLYILFFGLGGYLAATHGFTPGSFAIASLVLSFYAGGTNTVILRAALGHLAVERPGVPPLRLLPEAIERSYEGLVSTSVNIVKAAGLASTIALPETISVVNSIIAEGGDASTMMNLLLVFYFVFVLAVLGLLRAARGMVMRWI
ncbi:MAG: transporter substrate-binding domain-containing protein [Rhodobacteraceae bacterium]|nr:transporter substrate-binding domain-containing protein [Paracoccaceae bacterium]